MTKRLLCLSIFLAFCIVLLTIVSWRVDKNTQEESLVPDSGVDLTLQGVNLRQGKDGRLLWTLNATSADYAKGEGIVVVESPKILYFQEDKKEPLYVEGEHGRINQKDDQIVLWSNVLARYQGNLLETTRLDYNGTSRMIFFKQAVRLTGKNMIMTAEGARLNLENEQIHAQGAVRVVLRKAMR
ncbi:LPS export ABC transporter periplasmic protein LptC [Desulfoplanes sp.]